MEIEEVVPIQYMGKYARVFYYDRVLVEFLTAPILRTLFRESGVKKEVEVMETEQFFLIRYPAKPTTLIDKEKGRFYTFKTPYPLKEREHQVSIHLRLLKKWGLVGKTISKKVRVKSISSSRSTGPTQRRGKRGLAQQPT